MPERGVIHNRPAAEQIRDYSGLRWGTITPTDIDGFLDFRGRLFVLIELKYIGADMGAGQRLAYERLCKAITRVPVYCLVCQHDNGLDEDIKTATSILVEYWASGKWRKPKTYLTAWEAINVLLGIHGIRFDTLADP